MGYSVTGKHHVLTFESVADAADRVGELMQGERMSSYWSREMAADAKWWGADSVAAAVDAMLAGLRDEGIRAVENAADYVKRVQDESPAFQTVWDVTGHTVDVGAFLAGEPECMMMDVMAPTTQTVVPIVFQAGIHVGIKPKSVQEYGRQIMQLLLSVDAIGLQSEVWADLTCTGTDGGVLTIRIRVKAAGEYLDPGVIAYAVTRAGFCRGIMFPLFHALPDKVADQFGAYRYYGTYGKGAEARARVYPEGAFILPRLRNNDDASRDIVTPVLDKLTGRV